MVRYKCPACKDGRVTWDSRAQAFVCLSLGCGAWFDVPASAGVDSKEIRRMISRGALDVLPSCIGQNRGGRSVLQGA